MNNSRILIIDDEEPIAELVKASLEDHYNVAVATSAYSGIKYMNEHRADLILLDIKMPGMNGLEALEKIRAQHPEVIVIMLTAYASTQNIEKARNLGAYGFITKPFDVNELRNCIARAFTKGMENKALL